MKPQLRIEGRHGCRRWMSLVFLACLCLGSGRAVLAAGPAPGGNLLVIIADDVGTDGLKLFKADPAASLPPTPNIDGLARQGVLFRRAYAYPTCSPTRSTILTGRYGFRTGIGYALADPSEPVLRASEVTLPEVLNAQPHLGYRHANIGKWHLSFGASDPNALGGWEHFSGVLIGALPSYEVWPKTVNGETTSAYRGYATTDNVNDALAWIGRQGAQPWLLWMAFNAAHTPYHKPDNSLHGYDRLPDNLVAIQNNPRPYYEAMVEALDTEIGRLLAGVDRTRTTVVFLGDNGTLHTVIQPPYPQDRGKGTLYEGGIRIPMIIAGPGITRPGRESSDLVHSVDLYATLAELAGANLTAVVPSGHPVDSRSFASILRDEPFVPAEPCILAENFSATLPPEVAGRAALDGRYKLIRFDNGLTSFFDLQVDPVEKDDLLSRNAALEAPAQEAFHKLSAKLDAWREVAVGPSIARWHLGSDGFSVELSGEDGKTYQLQRSAPSAGTAWQNVGDPKTGASVTLTDAAPPSTSAFYRVSVAATAGQRH